MIDAILAGVFVGSLISGGVLGVTNCQMYKDWRESQEEEKTVYTFGSADGITTTADVPEVIITD